MTRRTLLALPLAAVAAPVVAAEAERVELTPQWVGGADHIRIYRYSESRPFHTAAPWPPKIVSLILTDDSDSHVMDCARYLGVE